MKVCPKTGKVLQGDKITPTHWKPNSTIKDIMEAYGKTCFEARNVHRAANLFKFMIDSGDTIWLTVAGAGPAGGMGGYIMDLIQAGFVDGICTTGAQAYHDAHFAYDLPVFQGSPIADDNALFKEGITRIYDIYIKHEGTLIAQDKIFQEFAKTLTSHQEISSADYLYKLGAFMKKTAPYPERSWIVAAYEYGVPVFTDSESNHSIGMNNAFMYLLGKKVDMSPSLSLLEAAGIVYASPHLSFIELGGGGPKNWVQTLAPMISQIIGAEFHGADRGIQITTASEKNGGLSGCTFNEAVTWGKYKGADDGLCQIWGEYSMIFPLIVGFALDNCVRRPPKRLMSTKDDAYKKITELFEEEQKNAASKDNVEIHAEKPVHLGTRSVHQDEPEHN